MKGAGHFPPPDHPPACGALAARGIPYRLFRHAGPVHSLEQAARERGQRPEQVVRSIVFRLGDGQFAMVLIAGAGQIAWPTLRRALGQRRVATASEAELLEATGYEIGAVTPLGLPRPMRLLADAGVFAPDEISIGSGVRGTTLILKSADLRRALGEVEVGRLAAG